MLLWIYGIEMSDLTIDTWTLAKVSWIYRISRMRRCSLFDTCIEFFMLTIAFLMEHFWSSSVPGILQRLQVVSVMLIPDCSVFFASSENRLGGCWVDKNAENSVLFVCGWRPLRLGSPSTHLCFPALGWPTKGNIFWSIQVLGNYWSLLGPLKIAQAETTSLR